MARSFHIVAPEDAEDRLDAFLTQETGESRSFIQKQIKAERVSLNGKVISKPSHAVSPGDTISGTMEESEMPGLVPIEGHLDILFEDDALLVINKPQGLVVHPAAGHRDETLVHYLIHRFQNTPDFAEMDDLRPGIVHRLDKGTSGVLLVAKTRKILDALSKQFAQRTTEKVYEAIAYGKMPIDGLYEGAIGRHRTDRKRMSMKTNEGREASTRFEAQKTWNNFTHVKLFPKTGRTHQLRVHCSENGHPLVGDPLYGVRHLNKKLEPLQKELREFIEPLSEAALHAAQLSFDHPTSGERLTFQAKRPERFDTLLSLIEEHDHA